MLTPEQDCLLRLSRMVWQKRGAAKGAGMPLDEETVTQLFLLDLQLNYPGKITIRQFTKSEEANNGADWAWAFVSRDMAWSITMLVQAKRLDDKERDYKGINRNIGKRVPPIRQIDQLITSANRYGIPPLYAFYNHLGSPSRVPVRCGSIPRRSRKQREGWARKQREGWGISIASAHTTRALLPDESFDTHARYSMPLHCMLCTGGSGDPGPKGSPGPVAKALNWLGPPQSSGPDGAVPGPDDFGLRQGLHPIVAAAMQVAEVEYLAERDAMAESLAEEFPGIAGVVVLQDGGKPKG